MFLSSSPSPPSPDSSTLLFPSRRYARCIGKAQRPSSDEATFSPSIRPSVRPRIRLVRSSIDSRFERFSKISQNSRFHSNRKFETKISPISPFIERIKVNSVITATPHPPALFSLHAHGRTTRRGRLSNSRYLALAPAASRNKCAFGPIIIVVPARKDDDDQDDDHDRR